MDRKPRSPEAEGSRSDWERQLVDVVLRYRARRGDETRYLRVHVDPAIIKAIAWHEGAMKQFLRCTEKSDETTGELPHSEPEKDPEGGRGRDEEEDRRGDVPPPPGCYWDGRQWICTETA